MIIRLIIKGVLLYVTLLICLITIGGIDSIYDNGYLIEVLLIVASLIYLCKTVISKEELDILLLNKK